MVDGDLASLSRNITFFLWIIHRTSQVFFDDIFFFIELISSVMESDNVKILAQRVKLTIKKKS